MSSHTNDSLIGDLELARSGCLPSLAFRMRAKIRMFKNYSVKSDKVIEINVPDESILIQAVDLHDSRLLLAYKDNSITIHDVHFTTVPGVYKQVGYLKRTIRGANNLSTGLACAKWRKYDCGLFTMTGNCNSLAIVDTEELVIYEEIAIHMASRIYDQTYCPMKPNLVGVVARSGQIHVCDLKIGAVSQTMQGKFKCLTSIAWSPKEDYKIVVASTTNEVIAWDIRSLRGELATTRIPRTPYRKRSLLPSVMFDELGNHLMCQTIDGRIHRIDEMKNYEESLLIEDLVLDYNPRRYQFSMDITSSPPVFFSPDGNNVGIYNLNTGEKLTECVGHTLPVVKAIHNRDTYELLSFSDDYRHIVWEP